VEGPCRWFAVDARYFMAAFLNDGGGPVSLRVSKKEKLFSVSRIEKITLAPGEKKEFTQRFYLGPKGYDSLAGLGLGLERAVNFGWFPSLGRGIHRALLSLRRSTGNFGWAIILLTFAVQLLLSPLTVHSFKHTQKMKTVQPQLKRIQEMYKGDPRRMQAETLALYQRHGLRFMGLEGCLPVLLQMPVFFALYSVLSKTYELRRAPWIGWIRDLSIHDPVFALPVLMGGAMFLQQKMTLSTTDPTQKQMMYIMPVMFTFIFLKMPSGLVLYWLTQSLLTWGFQVLLLKKSQSSAAVVP
jgi:YidC/Oxa1 family membrane protein insertase